MMKIQSINHRNALRPEPIDQDAEREFSEEVGA